MGAFGYSNPEWLLGPLGTFRVERLILLEMPGHDRARAKLLEKGIDIDAELAKVVKRVERVEVDLWNPGEVAGVLLRKAAGFDRATPLWANVSTGPNPWCIAASLAAVFAEIRVFHVNRAGSSIVHIPIVKQPAPSARELLVLKQLPSDGTSINGRLLKQRLREAQFFRESTGDKPAKVREQGQLNSILKPLGKCGALDKVSTGGRYRYQLGPSGSCILKMFASSER